MIEDISTGIAYKALSISSKEKGYGRGFPRLQTRIMYDQPNRNTAFLLGAGLATTQFSVHCGIWIFPVFNGFNALHTESCSQIDASLKEGTFTDHFNPPDLHLYYRPTLFILVQVPFFASVSLFGQYCHCHSPER